ncbi:LCP family protein [Streptomyces sp. NPDC001941]|uniref:LCP family protein n=1 Tax=Streptomyces sp. NPDC001941 TaxID=3154659 RepID=UPI00331AE053
MKHRRAKNTEKTTGTATQKATGRVAEKATGKVTTATRAGATGARSGARRRPRSRRSRITRVLLCTGLAAAVCAAGGGWYLYRDLTRSIGSSKALDDGAPRSKYGDTNILLMGLDSRKDNNGQDLPDAVLDKLHAGSSDIGGYNTNTLILLHVPGDGSKATAFSVPRDDLVELTGVPGHGKDKIKKAYGLAKYETERRLARQGVTDRRKLEHEGREAGRKAEIRTVRDFLGVPIDHFAEVNLAGFFHIADALGGVPVCLNKAVKDRYSGADFHAGRQTLDGQQALAFVRQRHGLPRGDLDRTRRQQAFLASAAHQLNSAGTFTDPGKLVKLLDTAKKDLVIDEGWDLLSFIEQAKNLSGGNVEFATLPIAGFGKHNNEDVNLVDAARVRDVVRSRLAKAPSGTPSPSDTPSAKPGAKPSAKPGAKPSGGAGDDGVRTLDGGGIPCVD